jgi:hypothetical protein
MEFLLFSVTTEKQEQVMKSVSVYSDTKLDGADVKVGHVSTRRSMGLPFCMAIIATLAGGCTAVPDTMQTASFKPTVSGYPSVAIGGQTPARHKAATEASPVKVAKANYFGHAPYVCTPSGFGRKAGCFLRG